MGAAIKAVITVADAAADDAASEVCVRATNGSSDELRNALAEC